MTTPDTIKKLNANQIFVFGSNGNGSHGGGAALLAKDSFGAIDGVSEGLTGQCYAFPTLTKAMKKVTKKALVASREALYKCALENPTKQFLLTKVGCGIAGFTEEEMKAVFKGDSPANIVMPVGWKIVKGYKAFEKGLVCRGFQYEFGKDFYHDGDIELCRSGFHFCKSLGEVYSYYNYGTDIVVCEIESEGEVIDEGEENKSVTNHLRIVRMLNAEEASNNNGVSNLGHSNTGHWNTGHWNTGDRNTGHWNTGDRNTGHRNTGDWNTTDKNNGSFNTKEVETIIVFNKPCSLKDWNNAYKPSCLYFDIKKWIYFSDMSEEEKSANKSAKTSGGYYKEIPYKEAFTKSMQKASSEQINQVKKLPNFDADVFEEISGFRIK